MESQRWWFAKIWLWLMVVFDVLSILALFVALGGYVHVVKTPVAVQLFGLIGLALQIVFIWAIFQWRLWGWWGILILGLVGFGLNLAAGYGLGWSSLGLIGLGLTYLVLRGGGELAIWPRLR